jgi:RNA polymerase sigma-70 factor (ECF subfamily)
MSKRTDEQDNDAFLRIYEANHGRIRGFLARTAGAQEAEDLTQVVFVKAARALPRFRGDARTSTWLYRIAANVVKDWLRTRSTLEARAVVQLPGTVDRAASASTANSDSQDERTSLERELIRDEMGDCIRSVIGQLPDKHRTVLVLGELGGFSDEEISQILAISRSNAKVRLHRARKQLKKALEARCDFSRDEDNEFVCDPKPSGNQVSSKPSDRTDTATSAGRPSIEAS